jgi:hypothetical protein
MTFIAKVIKLNHPADVAKFNREMRKTVKDTAASLSIPMSIEAQKYVTTRLRVGGKIGFKGDLANSIRRFTYGNKTTAKIWVEDKAIPNSPYTTGQEAEVNEFGVKKHFEPFKNNQKLYDWASAKGIARKGQQGIWVGGSGGNVPLGNSKNRFWEVTLNTMNYRIPTVFANAFIENFR